MATSFFGGAFFGGEFYQTPTPPPTPTGGSPAYITFYASKPINWVEVEKRKLELALARKRVQLKKVEKKIVLAEKKAAKTEPPRGILANLHLLEVKANNLIADIETIRINLDAILDFFGKLEFDEDDDDVFLLL